MASETESMDVIDQVPPNGVEDDQSEPNELIVEEDPNATLEQVQEASAKDEPLYPTADVDEEVEEQMEVNEPEEEEKEGDKRRSKRVSNAVAKKEKTAAQKSPAKAAASEKKAPPKASGKKKTLTPPPEVPESAGRGRKRRAPETKEAELPSKKRSVKPEITYKNFFTITEADRVLTCGEGEQLGHPGRTTTKKPRAINTLPEGIKIIQAVAGGVHTVILTADHDVYSCGVNEGGTVPAEDVEAEGVTDELKRIIFSEEIKKEGNIVYVVAGAGFTAALTDLGSVLAWGNLRDDNGSVEVHPLFSQMKRGPTVIIHHKNVRIVKIRAGENHLVMLSSDGGVYTFGEGSHGQLGGSARTRHIRSGYMADDTGKNLRRDVVLKGKTVVFGDIFAGGYWTMARAVDGRIFVCGLNNYGQLGLSIPEEESDGTEVQNEKLCIVRLTESPAFDASKKWTHVAGVKHIVARSDDGELYGIGLNTDNELGLGTYSDKKEAKVNWRYEKLQKIVVPGDVKIAGVDATLGASIAWSEDGTAFAFGYDTVGQLGLGTSTEDEKMVTMPKLIESAHLNDYKIIDVSIADNHAVFRAVKAA